MKRNYVLRKQAALDFWCKTLDGMRLGFLSRILRWAYQYSYRRWCHWEIQRYIHAYVLNYGVTPSTEWLCGFLKAQGEEFLIDGLRER